MPRFNESSALLFTRAIEAGITSPDELANIMGNASVETRRFSSMHESFKYRNADYLASQVPSAARRYTREEIQSAIASKDPEQIATVMYENRRDLGNNEVGDGWRFHGRGYFQYTGRYNYTTYGQKFGIDLQSNPDLAAEPELAAKLAIAYWKDKVPEHARHDPLAAGEIINGGRNGAYARVAASRQWAETITEDLVRDIQGGKVTLEQLASRDGSHSTIGRVQHNLNELGFTDARGQPLVVDGIRGGPGSRTNQAIEAFRTQSSLPAERFKDWSPAELLAATEVALDTREPLRRLGRTIDEFGERFSANTSGSTQEAAPRLVNGLPDYLLRGREATPTPLLASQPPRTGDTAPRTPQPAAPTPSPSQPDAELQPGHRGTAVLALQERLRLVGATDRDGRELQADGNYGSRTKDAVEQFQLWTSRETTGIADPATS